MLPDFDEKGAADVCVAVARVTYHHVIAGRPEVNAVVVVLADVVSDAVMVRLEVDFRLGNAITYIFGREVRDFHVIDGNFEDVVVWICCLNDAVCGAVLGADC